MPRAAGVTIDSVLKRRVAEKIRGCGEVIRFAEDPALASLCTCLGLQCELGNRDYDRLSPFFGVEPGGEGENPWRVDVFHRESELGIRAERRDGGRLQVRHCDFAHILAPESLDNDGSLARIVIYPARVAREMAARGFELVIVRDWLLTSCLQDDGNVTYLYANDWEIRNNIARTQIDLMRSRRLAFTGTHDIVDHLLGADARRFAALGPLYDEADAVYARVFPPGARAGSSALVLSYLVGILLDDLAQPVWYESPDHQRLARAALARLPGLTGRDRCRDWVLPDSFHALARSLRERRSSEISARFAAFVADL